MTLSVFLSAICPVLISAILMTILFMIFQQAKERRKAIRIIFVQNFVKIAEFDLSERDDALAFAIRNPESFFIIVEDTEILFFEQPAANFSDFLKFFVK